MTRSLNAISGKSAGSDLRTRLLAARTDAAAPRSADPGDLEIRNKFQDFVAGTFYKTMLKAMRDSQRPPKYFYGGQGEQIFQGQFDQQIAEQLARQHGDDFAGPLYNAYARASQGTIPAIQPTEAGHALDAAA